MASVFNTLTLQVRRSVNTPDFHAPWIIITESEANELLSVPIYYRNVDGTVMTIAEQAVADESILPELRNERLRALESQLNDYVTNKGYSIPKLMTLVQQLIDARVDDDIAVINALAPIISNIAQLQQNFQTAEDQINAAQDAESIQAVEVSLEGINL